MALVAALGAGTIGPAHLGTSPARRAAPTEHHQLSSRVEELLSTAGSARPCGSRRALEQYPFSSGRAQGPRVWSPAAAMASMTQRFRLQPEARQKTALGG